MRWFSPQDHSAPVIHPEKHAQSKYPGQPLPALPRQAVVFCLGKGLPLLQERFAPSLALDQLPGFITHSPVYQVEGAPHTCFLHGGYGAPQAACTVETLHALGVRELLLVGLCGAFTPELRVGDVLLPEKLWSEEGTTLHYRQESGFVQVPSQRRERLGQRLEAAGFSVYPLPTVTTDAPYRQTFRKEEQWRQLGCAGVDMEASAVAAVCAYYDMECTVALLVSDKHPLREGDAPWKWGSQAFPQRRDQFLAQCVAFACGDSPAPIINKKEEAPSP